MSRISNSSSAVARNKTLAPSIGLTRTCVPDFLTATRLLGWPWLRRISSRPLASFVRSSMCLSATAFWVASEATRSELTAFPNLNGELAGVAGTFEAAVGTPTPGVGAEIAGAGACGLSLGCEGAKLTGRFAATDAVLPPSASSRRSRKSVSRRPFEGNTWYPDFDEIGSAYQAVILALTRTRAPPEGVEFTCVTH